jgi:hypothetical protein
MDWTLLVGIAGFGGIGGFLLRRARQRRLTLTHHTVRCPSHGCDADVTARTDFAAYPADRHVSVSACSLFPSTPSVPPVRTTSFADLSPLATYVDQAGQAPCHPSGSVCNEGCLRVLNAAESGPAASSIRCTSGVSDSLELARQTQSPAICRLLWHHGT